ncbi:glycosyltransferase [Mycobacterium lehmannii]|uniref:glycosyltransferase n=1 Tax=Mycobacterium lehmannii TaxID=2048550 RepID=UPI001E4E7B81|nr:glycosyltransferase [Mycobacterium lehmannii]
MPVYRGEHTIGILVAELQRLTRPTTTPGGVTFLVNEIVLVHDHGPDRSDVVLLELEQTCEHVRIVWLSRNFGQDAATIAGLSVARGDWIVTMDEDGQHNPEYISTFLDTALAERADLVYSKPINNRPQGAMRNLTRRGAQIVMATAFRFREFSHFESFRLIRGDIGRQVAGIAHSGVYLDIALGWVVEAISHAPVALRAEHRDSSSYSFRRLFSLFWKMVLCSGTRVMRIVSMLGVTLGLLGGLLAAFVIYSSVMADGRAPEGWTSTIVVLLLCSGSILFSLGLIAEYLGVALHTLVGRPLYLTVETPTPRPFLSQKDVSARAGSG